MQSFLFLSISLATDNVSRPNKGQLIADSKSYKLVFLHNSENRFILWPLGHREAFVCFVFERNLGTFDVHSVTAIRVIFANAMIKFFIWCVRVRLKVRANNRSRVVYFKYLWIRTVIHLNYGFLYDEKKILVIKWTISFYYYRPQDRLVSINFREKGQYFEARKKHSSIW